MAAVESSADARVTGEPDTSVWVDIENPPQVQYLLPIARAARERGASTVVTARDYGDTLALLEARGEAFTPVGVGSHRGSRLAKGIGVLGRTRAFLRFFRREKQPDVMVACSRAAVLAARRMGIPSFVTTDYEHSDMTVYRRSRARIFFPDVIDPDVFVGHGIARERLSPYRGLKEDLTFAGVDVDAIPPAQLEGDPSAELVRVLFRPPAEESHYFSAASRSLALETLEYLARARGVVLVFSPRQPEQTRYLESLSFQHEPIVLRAPLPVVPLLKAVDLVITSGGTMLREAAYLGIPAYSIFQSEIAAVDRYLESVGRAHLLTGREELDRIQLVKRGGLAPLRTNPDLVDELAEMVLAAVRTRRSRSA